MIFKWLFILFIRNILKDGIVADTIRCSLFLWTLSQDNFSAHPTSCLYFPRKKIIEPVGCEKINIYNPNRIVLNTYLIFILIWFHTCVIAEKQKEAKIMKNTSAFLDFKVFFFKSSTNDNSLFVSIL